MNLPGVDIADTRPPVLGARERLIIALDYPCAGMALDIVDRLGSLVQWFKVGLELYLAEGNSIVENLRERGYSVFLDLKLHDIPNTVAGAVRSAALSGAGMLTIHAAGGPAMLAAAQEAAEDAPFAPKLLAVTVLTSLDAAQLAATGVIASPGEQVLLLAEIAHAAGIRGLVASPQEIARLRSAYPGTTLVIPGIRPSGAKSGDQKRVATPGAAIAEGADYLVVGRPITQASNITAAAQSILNEMETAAKK